MEGWCTVLEGHSNLRCRELSHHQSPAIEDPAAYLITGPQSRQSLLQALCPVLESVVISAEDPRIVAIRKVTSAVETLLRLSASPVILISSPEEQICATEEDPTAETQETSGSLSPREGSESIIQPGPISAVQDFPLG